MREIANRERILKFMEALGATARQNARAYLTEGATAVLVGWRDATIDLDLRFEPELDELFRALPSLKEELGINIKLASPADFIPPLPGWETRSRFISRHEARFLSLRPVQPSTVKDRKGAQTRHRGRRGYAA